MQILINKLPPTNTFAFTTYLKSGRLEKKGKYSSEAWQKKHPALRHSTHEKFLRLAHRLELRICK